jgi:hypothetical protein
MGGRTNSRATAAISNRNKTVVENKNEATMNSVKTRAKSGVSGPNAHQTPVTPIRPGNKKPKPGNTSGDSGATPNRIKDLKKGAMEHWRNAQHDYFLRKGSRRSGCRWIIALIKKLADVAWDFWSYRNYLTHQLPTPQDNEANLVLDELIRHHHEQGLSALPDRYAWMFQQSGDEVINSRLHVKRAWLFTLITAKIRLFPLPGLFQREQEALSLCTRDAKLTKRRKTGHDAEPPALRTTATRIRSNTPWYDIHFTADELDLFNNLNDEDHTLALDIWATDWCDS